MKRILAILLVAAAALAAGDLFGGGAHAHPNPPGSNTATVTDHYAHVLVDSIDGKDPRFVVVGHETTTYEWEFYIGGGIVSSGFFGWPPASGSYVSLTPHNGRVNSGGSIYVVDTNYEFQAPFVTFRTLANGSQGYYIPKIDIDNKTANSVTFTLTFKDAGNHAVALSTDGTTPITATEATLVSEGVLRTATHTITGLSQDTEYTILASQVNGSAGDATTSKQTFTTETCNDGFCSSIPQQGVNEGETVDYVIPVTNPEGADTTWSITSGQKGDAAINTTTGRFTWTTTEADGADTPHEFGINVLVGTNSSDGTLAVMVNETNQAPVFETNQTQYSAPIGVEFQLDLNATDADIPAQTISYRIESQTPEDNPAEINNQTGMLTWTPDGYDPRLITVLAVDDFETPANSSITLNITVPNTPPTTTAASILVNQSGTESIDLAAAGHIDDAEQNATTLTVSIDDTPAQTQGMASANGTVITYTANAMASGDDVISYTVTDDGSLSATGSIAVTIRTPNTPPRVESFVHNVTAVPEQPLEIPITSRISDDQQSARTLIVHVPVQPQKGSAFHENGTITYTANRDTSGNDTITYGVVDSGGLNATGTITVTIQPDTVPKPAPQNNTAPVAENFTHGTAAVPGQPLEIPIIQRISDEQQPAEMLNVTIPVRPGQGNATYDNGTITYTADSGAAGNDTISYLVVDDGGLNATGIITVTISAQAPTPNTPPTAGDVNATATTGQTITINLAPHVDDDEDAAADLAVSIAVQPTLGNASTASGSQEIQYMAGQNAGTDTITYMVADSGGLNATGAITITISAGSTPAPNTPPTAGDVRATADTGQTITINLAPHVDDNEDAATDLAVSIAVLPTLGNASIVSGAQEIQYMAGQNAGTDTITYMVADSGGLNATGAITITISAGSTPAPNTPPTAQSFTHDIPAVPGTPLDIPITARVSDDAPLGDPPNVAIPSPPNQGTATYAGGTITYTANAGATGTDTITYVVTDAGSLTATGTITVQIQPPRGTPGPVTPEPVTPEPGLGSTVPIRQCTR